MTVDTIAISAPGSCVTPNASRLPELPDLRLQFKGGGLDGQVITTGANSCVIGSGGHVTIRLVGDGIQPQHCFIMRGPAGMIIRQLHSDTLLNGEDFDDADLEPGDVLTLGPVDLQVVAPEAQREFEAANTSCTEHGALQVALQPTDVSSLIEATQLPANTPELESPQLESQQLGTVDTDTLEPEISELDTLTSQDQQPKEAQSATPEPQLGDSNAAEAIAELDTSEQHSAPDATTSDDQLECPLTPTEATSFDDASEGESEPATSLPASNAYDQRFQNLENLLAETGQALANVAGLQTRLADQESELGQLRAQVQQLDTQLTASQQRADESQAANESLAEELANLKAEFAQQQLDQPAVPANTTQPEADAEPSAKPTDQAVNPPASEVPTPDVTTTQKLDSIQISETSDTTADADLAEAVDAADETEQADAAPEIEQTADDTELDPLQEPVLAAEPIEEAVAPIESPIEPAPAPPSFARPQTPQSPEQETAATVAALGLETSLGLSVPATTDNGTPNDGGYGGGGFDGSADDQFADSQTSEWPLEQQDTAEHYAADHAAGSASLAALAAETHPDGNAPIEYGQPGTGDAAEAGGTDEDFHYGGESGVSNTNSDTATGYTGLAEDEELAFTEPSNDAPIDTAAILAKFGHSIDQYEPDEQPAAPPIQEEATPLESEDDEFIEDYMAQLMARVGGSSEPGAGDSGSKPAATSAPTTPAAAPAQPVASPAATPTPTAAAPERELPPLDPAEFLPRRRVAPEASSNLRALRAVANSSARTHLHKHQTQALQRAASLYIFVAIVCGVVSLSMASFAKVLFSLPTLVSLIAMLICVVTGIRSVACSAKAKFGAKPETDLADEELAEAQAAAAAAAALPGGRRD